MTESETPNPEARAPAKVPEPYDPSRDPIACVFRVTQYGNHLGQVVLCQEVEHGGFDERNSEWMGMCNVNVQVQTPQGLAMIPRQYRFHIHGASDPVSAFLNFNASLEQEQETIQRWVKEDIAREQAAMPRIQLAGRQPARAERGHGAHGGR